MPESLTLEEASTREVYNEHAQDYLARWHCQKHGFLGKEADRLSKFRELLSSGRILEIGCGGGHDARWFVDNGYDYLGVDFYSGMLEQARGDNPGIRFDQTSVYDLDFDEPFDGFWCAAVLLHIPKNRVDGEFSKPLNDSGYQIIERSSALTGRIK